jgi:dihydrofolate reductase
MSPECCGVLPGQAVATLRAEPGRDILVLNSATLIQSMLAAGLVDDLRPAVVPVLLGGALGWHYQRR